MIKLSNGHELCYLTASGALGFSLKGWLWERPLVYLGLIQPELFTNVIKTLTLNPRNGNLRWWKPWTCVKLLPGGAVNKVGLTNKGIDWWYEEVAPKINFDQLNVIGSIFGTEGELLSMANIMNNVSLVGLEINCSCPNTGEQLDETQVIINAAKKVHEISSHPIILKLSYTQDYLKIAEELQGVVEAISLNSVPWATVFPNERSPLWRLEKKVGGGGGGVSGQPIQKFNWQVVKELSEQGLIPVIGSSVMSYEDVIALGELGAAAISFSTVHLPSYPIWRNVWTIFTNPCRPTAWVKRINKL